MEELLVYAILLCEDLMTESDYSQRLDALFLSSPESDDLLYLECEADLKRAVTYIRTHFDYTAIDHERFGRILMNRLKTVYKNCPDISIFASRMFCLWESLPGNVKNIELFLL